MTDLLFDTKRAGERLGLAPATLSKLRVRGEGPRYLKLGSRVLYPAAELDAWVASKPLLSSTAEGTARRPRAGRPPRGASPRAA